MSHSPDNLSQLRRELEETRARLAEAEETLNAIRNGELDGLVIAGPEGQQVFTLTGAQEPYRLLIEQMSEGTLTLSREGVILYANQTLVRLLQTPLERVIGAELRTFVSPADQPALAGLIEEAWRGSSRGEVSVRAADGSSVPLRLGLSRLQLDPETFVCVVATNLTEERKKEDDLRRLYADLEKRIEERTTDLAASRLAALNMMEEAVEAREATEATNRQLRQEMVERKRAEAELRESDERVELAVQSAELGMWDFDLVNDTAWHSLRHDQIFGYESLQPEWGQKIFLTHVLPEDLEQVKQRFAEALATGKLRFECRIAGADRVRRWIYVHGQVQRDAQGKPVRMLGSVRDITEPKQAEEEFRMMQNVSLVVSEAEDFRSALCVALQEICRATGWVHGEVWAPNPEATLLTRAAEWNSGRAGLEQFNAASERFTFAPGEGLPGRVWQSKQPLWIRDVTVDSDYPRAAFALEAGLKGAVGVPVLADREVVAVMAFFVLEPREKDDHFVSLVTTAASHLGTLFQRKRAEERMRQQAALLDAANDAIYVRALDHTVTYWNAGAERLYGWPRAEALGRKLPELARVDAAAFEAAHVALLEQGSWSGELTKTSKAGKKLVVFCRWTLLWDEQGQPAEVLAINTDITEKKQLEAQFLRAQRMESVGSLAGGIAHDLNNILAPILMSTSLLREVVSDAESLSMLDTVEGCAQRGADIIRQLLTFARGKPGVRVPLPVCHILNEMVKIVRETFPRNIQVRINTPKNLWPVMGDATQIHQALMNLSVNARDAMPDGGTLTLAAANLALDEAFAATTPDAKPGDYVCVSVTDTGSGIPRKHLDRIFDPFFTTKEIGGGTGLGLASVLGIVRGHGGFVQVNSKVGQGATFELYLPASPEAKVIGSSGAETLPPRGQGELILVVDDEAGVRDVVQRTLERHGYRVMTAAEGAEALAVFTQHRAEVRAVLTDIMMPGKDGSALVRALRHMDPRLPIIGMTGLDERNGIKGLEGLDLPKVLTKPFQGVELLAALHEALAAEAGN